MEMSFEESLKELEGIVDKLEKGQLSLDECLLLFEKGIKLVRECNTKLNNAQQKVERNHHHAKVIIQFFIKRAIAFVSLEHRITRTVIF